MKDIIITKQIAKHGKQSVIIIPSFLRDKLKPKTIVRATISIVEDEEGEKQDVR
jgi:hypothetical protein